MCVGGGELKRGGGCERDGSALIAKGGGGGSGLGALNARGRRGERCGVRVMGTEGGAGGRQLSEAQQNWCL